MTKENAWDLAESEGFGDYDAIITDAAFVQHEKFVDDDGNPRCVLALTLQPDDLEMGPWEKLYPCGPGILAVDGGKSAVREIDPDNTSVRFSPNARIGRFIKAMTDITPVEVLTAIADRDLGQNDAAAYVGLKFHWDLQKFQSSKRVNGEWVPTESEVLVPTAFLEAAKSGGAKKAAAKKAPAKKKAAEKAESGPPQEMLDLARSEFDAAGDFEAFAKSFSEAVVALDSFEENAEWALDEDEHKKLWNGFIEE